MSAEESTGRENFAEIEHLQRAWRAGPPVPALDEHLTEEILNASDGRLFRMVQCDVLERHRLADDPTWQDEDLTISIEHYRRILGAIDPDTDIARIVIEYELRQARDRSEDDFRDRIAELSKDFKTDVDAVVQDIDPDQETGSFDMPPTERASFRQEARRKKKPEYAYAKKTKLGPYTLRKPLGQGGFGEVWRADRKSPHMVVAIKLIRPERRADKESLARFAAEKQALALLDHPNIAKIHDAGIAEDGAPFLVMEYVEGVSLTEYCDREKVSVPERLKLFSKVCDAVHHAHTQGVIHRDLKPDNVLVTVPQGEEPQPKVVDFGIAKAANKNLRLTDKTLTLDLNALIGTPEYMSPEQAESTQTGVSTKTDIFALGVMLYELLTGVLPIPKEELRDLAIEIVLQRIRHERPEPSSRITSLGREDSDNVAYRRGEIDFSELRRLLRGRIRHIPMKALRTDRTKRFSSAAAMATDIQNYLEGKDFVEAAAEPRWDKAIRSIKRHKLAYVSAAAIALLLVSGIIGTSWGMQRAEAARQAEAEQRAVAEKREHEAVAAREEAEAAKEAEAMQRVVAEEREQEAVAARREAEAAREAEAEQRQIAEANERTAIREAERADRARKAEEQAKEDEANQRALANAEAERARRAEERAIDEAKLAREAEEKAVTLAESEAKARADAEREARRANEVSRFLTEILASANPANVDDPDLTVRALMQHAYERLEEENDLDDFPEVKSILYETIGRALRMIGDSGAARDAFGQAVSHYRAAGAPDPEILVELLVLQASAESSRDDSRRLLFEAQDLLEERGLVRSRLLIRVGAQLAGVAGSERFSDEGADAFFARLAEFRGVSEEQIRTEIERDLEHVRDAMNEGDTTAAEQIIRRYVRPYMLPGVRDEVPRFLMAIAHRQERLDDPLVATAFMKSGVALSDELYRESHPYRSQVYQNAGALLMARQVPAAAEYYRVAHTIALHVHGLEHYLPRYLAAMLAESLAMAERYDEALQIFVQNEWDDDGMSIQHVAARNNCIHLYRAIFESSPVFHPVRDSNGSTALPYAIGEGHIELAELLLQYGFDVNDRADDGTTPLLLAASHGNTAMVALLLQHEADYEYVHPEHGTAAHLAARNNHPTIMRILNEFGVPIDTPHGSSGVTPLHDAAHNNAVEAITALIDLGIDPSEACGAGWRALHYAAARGYVTVIEALLNAGASFDAVDEAGNQPLRRAALNGHAPVVRTLIEAGADLHAANAKGYNALSAAAAQGHLEVVSLLLASGASIESFDNNGWRALHWAAHGGRVDVIEVLLLAGAGVDAADNDGGTPLRLAAGSGHMEAVRALLQAGADVNARTRDGFCALSNASLSGHAEVVRVLLDAGAAVEVADNNGWRALHWAAHGGRVDVIEVLLLAGAGVDAADNDGGTPLRLAAGSGHMEAVRALLQAGTDVNARTRDGFCALSNASLSGHAEVVRVLLDAGAAVEVADNNGRRALHWAAHGGHVDVIEVLLRTNAGIDAAHNEGWRALHYASAFGHTDAVRVLLDAGAAVDAAANDGQRPLHWAVRRGYVDVVRMLLLAGAAVDAADNEGWRPSHLAASNGWAELTEVLLQRGANPNARTVSGGTPILWAILSDADDAVVTAIVQTLLDLGAEADAIVFTEGHVTALHRAAGRANRSGVCRLLLKHGADPNARSTAGETPLHWSAANDNHEVTELLLRYGADPDARCADGKHAADLATTPESKARYAELVNLHKNAVGVRAESE